MNVYYSGSKIFYNYFTATTTEMVYFWDADKERWLKWPKLVASRPTLEEKEKYPLFFWKEKENA